MTKGDNSQVYQEQEEEQGSGLHPQFICSQVSKEKTRPSSYRRLESRQKVCPFKRRRRRIGL
jgi:hypothetical protein